MVVAGILSRIMWALVALAILVFGIDGYFSFVRAQSAPQEAAAAAMACFSIILPYLLARAVDGVLGVNQTVSTVTHMPAAQPLVLNDPPAAATKPANVKTIVTAIVLLWIVGIAVSIFFRG